MGGGQNISPFVTTHQEHKRKVRNGGGKTSGGGKKWLGQKKNQKEPRHVSPSCIERDENGRRRGDGGNSKNHLSANSTGRKKGPSMVKTYVQSRTVWGLSRTMGGKKQRNRLVGVPKKPVLEGKRRFRVRGKGVNTAQKF